MMVASTRATFSELVCRARESPALILPVSESICPMKADRSPISSIFHVTVPFFDGTLFGSPNIVSAAVFENIGMQNAGDWYTFFPTRWTRCLVIAERNSWRNLVTGSHTKPISEAS